MTEKTLPRGQTEALIDPRHLLSDAVRRSPVWREQDDLACMRKLLTILNVMVRTHTRWIAPIVEEVLVST